MKKVSRLWSILAVCGILVMAGCSGSSSKSSPSVPAEINANLSGLTLSSGTLSPSFDKDTTAYAAEVASSVTSVSVTPTADTSSLTITVNGNTVASGSSADIALSNTGSTVNPVVIVVTGSDKTTTKTYTINVTRVAISSIANLASLVLSSGTLSPLFAVDTTSYTVEVPYTTSVMAVTPTVAGVEATVTVNGASISSGSASQNIELSNIGSTVNTITIIVTAQDKTVKTYTINVTRVAISSNANLAGLTVSHGTLSPTFASGTTSYTAAVVISVSSITVTPTSADSTATITVNGTSVTSGNASSVISVSTGTTITIVVTAISGTTKSYVITVDVNSTGEKTTYTLGGVSFSEIQTTSSTVSSTNTITFPMGLDDSSTGTISAPFAMSETDVTYELWTKVRTWAASNGYTIVSAGQNGADASSSYAGFSTSVSTQYPVANVDWRSAMVWCNALTEYYNANNGTETDLAVVYCSDSVYKTPIRTSTSSSTITYTTAGTQDAPYVNASANGFRLPTSAEYEFAARYIGTTVPTNTNVVLKGGVYYTNGASASGATATYKTDAASFTVAVFSYFSSGTSTGVTGTAVVKSKTANALGLYDMSGNLWKLNFDWSTIGSSRVMRGGGFDDDNAATIRVGYVNFCSPCYSDGDIGFRFSRTK